MFVRSMLLGSTCALSMVYVLVHTAVAGVPVKLPHVNSMTFTSTPSTTTLSTTLGFISVTLLSFLRVYR
jgi:hypothetical protein